MTVLDVNHDAHVIRQGRVDVVLSVLTLVTVLLVHTAGRVGGYCSPIEADDSYIYASFGCRIAGGDVLYRDMSDIKPPGLFMLYAVVYKVMPPARSSIIPIESLFLLLGYWAIFRLAARLYGTRISLFVTVIAALSINYFTVMGFAIGGFGLAEGFMVFLAAAGVLAYANALRSRLAWLFVCGLCVGFDSAIKQTALPVIAALAMHWTMATLVIQRRALFWLAGTGLLVAGGVIAWSPFVAVMWRQGTLGTAFALLTADAETMIGRGSAWPSSWRDVMPLWVPLAWGAWAIAAVVERAARRRSACNACTHDGHVRSVLALLALWAAAEAILVTQLPLRSAHYYVSACVPFVLLTGAPLLVFRQQLAGLAIRRRVVCWAMAIVASGVILRPVADEIAARALSRYATYDWQAEQRRFDEALDWGAIHFGRGPAWVGDIDAPP